MTLADAIAEALANSAPPPPNESTTCEWIVYPLLLGAGYARRDIVSRVLDNNSQFPDYMILPDSAHTWFLEVKAWSVPLQDSHAQQALNYANQNGKRWVVLTNGKEWRLYDNQIQGIAADKLVSTARLERSEEIQQFITALGKQSVTSGALHRYVIDSRLQSILNLQLQDENSELLRALYTALRRQPSLGAVTRADIVRNLSRRTANSQESKAAPPHDGLVATKDAASVSRKAEGHSTLDELLRRGRGANEYMYPSEITLPDGSVLQAHNWKPAAIQFVEWVARNGVRPSLPFRGSPSGKRYFINVDPQHADYPMNLFAEVPWGETTAYVHTGRSAFEYVQCLHALCEAANVSPSQVKLRMTPWGKAARQSTEESVAETGIQT